MSSTDAPKAAPTAVALQPGEGDARWFLGALLTIKASGETTDGGVAVIEHHAPQGHGSPLHVHHKEDEWFYVTEGVLTFWLGGEVTRAAAGSFIYLPRDVPHTFLVSSPEARFLLVVEPAGFEGFVREMSEPAREQILPPAAVQPPSPEEMTATASKYGLDILGPPGIPG